MTVKNRTKDIEQAVAEYAKLRRTIEADGDLKPEAKNRMLRELAEEHRGTFDDALDAVAEGYDAELEALRSKAETTTEEPEKLDAILREIRLDRLERRFAAEIGRGGPSAERYREVVAGGDPLAAEAYESVAELSGTGLGYGLTSAIEENREARREAGMTPEQHRASGELRALELDRESAVAMGEMAGPRGSSSRERFVTRLLDGRGLRSVHRDEHGWVSTDEAAALDAEEVA